jgi:hypothetical protein
VAAVEDDDLAAPRHLLVDAPEVVVSQLGGSGHLEGGHPHALGIDPLKDAADYPVLATGVHALQDNQNFMLGLRKEQLLQGFQLGVELLEALLGVVFIGFPGSSAGRVPIREIDGLVGGDQIPVPLDVGHGLLLLNYSHIIS